MSQLSGPTNGRARTNRREGAPPHGRELAPISGRKQGLANEQSTTDRNSVMVGSRQSGYIGIPGNVVAGPSSRAVAVIESSARAAIPARRLCVAARQSFM
jgi:hypothetical protein